MNKLNFSRLKWILGLLAVSVLSGACSDDDDPAWMVLEPDYVYIDGWGQTQTVSIRGESLRSVTLKDIPNGWTIKSDLAAAELVVTSPEESDASAVRSGVATVTGHSMKGNPIIRKLFVGVVDKKDLSDRQANCFLLTEPYTIYSFDTTRKGETEETLPTADVRLLWQTKAELIKNLTWENGKVSFYVDGKDNAVIGGNALVAAYDAAGNLIWSWHLWVVDAARVKEQTYANGKTFMNLNLGAQDNANATREQVLESFGCFYQWGRKDPFVGPETYNAAKGADAKMYDATGGSVLLTYENSTAETGTAAYAAAHPLTYILGVAETEYDWLYAASAEALWTARKTANDPCPKGWRVPAPQDFEGLRIADPAAGRESDYGWMLTDGVAEAFYPGAGFRTYLTGHIQNLYNPLSGVEVPLPWVGYYWTQGMQARTSAAFYFWFDAQEPGQSGIEPSVWQKRANGMQVRCVKE